MALFPTRTSIDSAANQNFENPGSIYNAGQKITNQYDVPSVITNLLNIIGEFI